MSLGRTFLFLLLVVLGFSVNCFGASFDGAAGIHVQDPSGALSWDSQKNALSVSCWFRISIPSGNSISSDMVIVSDRTSGNKSTDPYAYLIQVNAAQGNVEFVQRGTNSTVSVELIEHPYIDRWYHVAVVLSGGLVYPYIDGKALPSVYAVTDGIANTNGVSVGCWASGNFFRGEIQEVSIFQSSVAYMVNELKFMDIPAEYHSFLSLNGYFKLGARPEGLYRYVNYAANPPTGTEYGTKIGNGTISFESPDTAVEQSLFDANKNGGENAIIPLSGAFTWKSSALNRPVTGIPFSFDFGYSSAVALFSTADDGLQPAVLSPGWRHSFEMRMAPTQSSTERQIITPSGAVDTWDRTTEGFVTRHKVYRGTLRKLDNDDYEWTAPDLKKYRFYDPTYSAVPWEHQKRGRLYEIEDRNNNKIQIKWNGFVGVVTQVVDTVGGVYNFRYNAQNLLTNVNHAGWGVSFAYSNNLLSSTWRTAPPEYQQKDTATRFEYDARGLLIRICNPGHTNPTITVEYDGHGRVVSETDALLRTRTVQYGKPSGRDISRTDPEGNLWIESYDRKHRLISRKDPLGNSAEYAYDASGNKVSETDPNGNTTYYAYDEHSNLTATTNPVGVVTKWQYDLSLNEITNHIDALGWRTSSEYDLRGNLLRQFDGYGDILSRSYLSNGLMTVQVDGNGNAFHYEYTADGYLAVSTDPAGNPTYYARNALGWVLAVTNSLGEVTSFQFDSNGNVIRTTDALGNSVAKQYDENNNLVSITDARGSVISNTYDEANQLLSTKDASGAVYTRTYTALGLLSTVADPYGNTSSNMYDAAGRLIGSVDAAGRVSQQRYDANGNTIGRIDPLGNEWGVVYDPLNRPIEERDPLGNVVRTTYDELGRKKTVASPNGGTLLYEYDSRSRLAKWFDPEGGEWIYQYDQLANITNISDARGGHYVMEYGTRNERTLERNQDGFEWQYSYDPLLRLTQMTDPNGLVKSYSYDAGGRVRQVTFNSGRVDAYEYDANGNPTNIVRQSGAGSVSTALEYDSLNRVSAVIDTFGNRVAYGRDLRGQIADISYPDGLVISNSYNTLGQIVRQVDWDGRVTEYEYDEAGRIAGRSFPNGVVQTNGFDSAGRLTALAYRADGQQLLGYRFGYDANGNLLESTEEGAAPVSSPAEFDENLEYTAANRLISKADAVADEEWTYFYDASGNMTNMASPSASYSFQYDEDNRVVRIDWNTPGTNVVIENKYDALGRRIAKTVNGVEVRYVLDLSGDMEKILAEQDSGGAVLKHHVFGASGLNYTADAGDGIQYYQNDNIGNVVLVTDSSAGTVARYGYSPYGKILSAGEAEGTPFKFAGHFGIMEDLPNIYFMRARYYSADTGSFLSTDSIKNIGPGWMPIAYGYANGNPMTFIDKNGRQAYVVESDLFFGSRFIQSYIAMSSPLLNFAMDVADIELVHQEVWKIGDSCNINDVIGGGFSDPCVIDRYGFDANLTNWRPLSGPYPDDELEDRVNYAWAKRNAYGAEGEYNLLLNNCQDFVSDFESGPTKAVDRANSSGSKDDIRDNHTNQTSGKNTSGNVSAQNKTQNFLDAYVEANKQNTTIFDRGIYKSPPPPSQQPKKSIWESATETITKVIDNVKNWWSKLF